MGRIQAFEIHESPHCPRQWRDLFTDFMSFYGNRFRPYAAVSPWLAEGLRASGTDHLVDLCSGGGSSVLTLLPELEQALGRGLRVTLTDLFPNHEAFREAARCNPDRIQGHEIPVDAAQVPSTLPGFRTVFTAFHHFPPSTAKAVLEDAVAQGQGIGIFEYTERNLMLWAWPLLVSPFLMWGLTPWIRPFRWQRLLWTYLLPVLPLMGVWDGFVSCLRTYEPEEMMALAGAHPGYVWHAGRLPSIGRSRVTYLVGWPSASMKTPAEAGSAGV